MSIPNDDYLIRLTSAAHRSTHRRNQQPAEESVRCRSMTYSFDKPTKPGWYWCFNPLDNSEFVCRVDYRQNAPGLFCSWMTAPGSAALMHESDWAETTMWAGPLDSDAYHANEALIDLYRELAKQNFKLADASWLPWRRWLLRGFATGLIKSIELIERLRAENATKDL